MKKQYNSKGFSNIMTVSMDETQEKVYIGMLDGCRVFAERLMIDQLHFATIKGENVSLTEAIEKGLTSVSDWKNGAWKIRKEGDAEILKLWTDETKTYYIGGYSLAGLFALWAAYRTDVFKGVAAASQSMWFPGFADYMKEHEITAKAFSWVIKEGKGKEA